jgi:hypothetical protein
MIPSAGLVLLALLRRIGSIGNTLKSFILRCLLFWPRVLRSHGLRRIWPLCLQSSPKDAPKRKGGQAGPSFAGNSGVCEGYSTIYASRHSNRASEPRLPLGSGSAEALPLSPIVWQSQSASHSPASSISLSLPGSPQRSNRRLSGGSASSIASSHNADSIHSTRQLTILHVNTPLTSTHSRVTSTQFAGVPPGRSRSPSPIPIPLPVSFPSPISSPLPSPSPSLQTHPLPQSSTPESSGSTQISNVVPNSQATSEGSRPSSFDIRVSPPSRSQTLETSSAFSSQSPLFVQNLSGRSQSPNAESEHATRGPSGLGPPYPASANAPYNSGILPVGIPTPSPDQAQHGPSFPQPSIPLPVVYVPAADISGILSDGRTRSIRLMNSEQVSRDMNKGDV